MMKAFTQNDILRYAYNEMSRDESCELASFLKTDRDLNKEADEIFSMVRSLNNLLLSPGQNILDEIRSFSRQALA